MESKSTTGSLGSPVLAGLLVAALATPGRASYLTTELPPSSVSTSKGLASAESISVLATQELSGTATDPGKAQHYSPAASGYQGIFRFDVPAGLDVAAASGVSLVANLSSPLKETQRWTFQVRDFTIESWITLGYNDVAASHTWQTLSFPLAGDFGRFVDAAGQMQVRYSATTAVDSSDLDQLVFAVTRYVAAAPPPPRAPTPSQSPGTPELVQGVRTVFKGSFSNTDDQVSYVANLHDLQIFNGIGPSKIAAVHAANPAALLYTYQKIAGLHGPDAIVPAGDPAWPAVVDQDLLWYGPSGAPVTQTQNLWYYVDIIDPAKRAAWVPMLVASIESQLALGYDAVFLDNADVIDPTLITEYPASYSDPAYYQAIGEVLKAVRAALPGRKLILNSYIGAAAPGNRGLELLDDADTLFFEGFSMKASARFFSDRARYLQQLGDFAGVVASGKSAVAMDMAPAADLERRMWSLASYLLVNSPRSYHYYAATDASSELQSYPEDTLDLGVATSDLVDRADGLVTRSYAGGTVVVNPDLASRTYAMESGDWQRMVLAGGGAYPATGSITWTAVSGTSMDLAPNTAVIVRLAR